MCQAGRIKTLLGFSLHALGFQPGPRLTCLLHKVSPEFPKTPGPCALQHLDANPKCSRPPHQRVWFTWHAGTVQHEQGWQSRQPREAELGASEGTRELLGQCLPLVTTWPPALLARPWQNALRAPSSLPPKGRAHCPATWGSRARPGPGWASLLRRHSLCVQGQQPRTAEVACFLPCLPGPHGTS